MGSVAHTWFLSHLPRLLDAYLLGETQVIAFRPRCKDGDLKDTVIYFGMTNEETPAAAFEALYPSFVHDMKQELYFLKMARNLDLEINSECVKVWCKYAWQFFRGAFAATWCNVTRLGITLGDKLHTDDEEMGYVVRSLGMFCLEYVQQKDEDVEEEEEGTEEEEEVKEVKRFVPAWLSAI